MIDAIIYENIKLLLLTDTMYGRLVMISTTNWNVKIVCKQFPCVCVRVYIYEYSDYRIQVVTEFSFE